MNVSLASQTISNSVADAIDYLRKIEIPEFEGSEATTHFIRIFDRLFDMTNARSSFGSNYKSPLTLKNLNYFINVFGSSINYISKLKIDGISIFFHRRSTFAKGFVINMYSIVNLAKDLFTKTIPLTFLLPYKCSQDHLELFFSCIRARGA